MNRFLRKEKNYSQSRANSKGYRNRVLTMQDKKNSLSPHRLEEQLRALANNSFNVNKGIATKLKGFYSPSINGKRKRNLIPGIRPRDLAYTSKTLSKRNTFEQRLNKYQMDSASNNASRKTSPRRQNGIIDKIGAQTDQVAHPSNQPSESYITRKFRNQNQNTLKQNRSKKSLSNRSINQRNNQEYEVDKENIFSGNVSPVVIQKLHNYSENEEPEIKRNSLKAKDKLQNVLGTPFHGNIPQVFSPHLGSNKKHFQPVSGNLSSKKKIFAEDSVYLSRMKSFFNRGISPGNATRKYNNATSKLNFREMYKKTTRVNQKSDLTSRARLLNDRYGSARGVSQKSSKKVLLSSKRRRSNSPQMRYNSSKQSLGNQTTREKTTSHWNGHLPQMPGSLSKNMNSRGNGGGGRPLSSDIRLKGRRDSSRAKKHGYGMNEYFTSKDSNSKNKSKERISKYGSSRTNYDRRPVSRHKTTSYFDQENRLERNALRSQRGDSERSSNQAQIQRKKNSADLAQMNDADLEKHRYSKFYSLDSAEYKKFSDLSFLEKCGFQIYSIQKNLEKGNDVYDLIRLYADFAQEREFNYIEKIFIHKEARTLFSKILKIERWGVILLFYFKVAGIANQRLEKKLFEMMREIWKSHNNLVNWIKCLNKEHSMKWVLNDINRIYWDVGLDMGRLIIQIKSGSRVVNGLINQL